MFNKKNIKRICKNCKLYNPAKGECSVVILHEGQRMRIPVLAEDACFFEEPYFDPTTNSMENFADELREVKFWVEDENGEKTSGNGTVKMECPEDFIVDEKATRKVLEGEEQHYAKKSDAFVQKQAILDALNQKPS